MCEYCHSFPHLPGCPNAPEPRAVYECEYCGEGIYPGDKYVELDGMYYHWKCIDNDFSYDEIIELLQLNRDMLFEIAGVDINECEEEYDDE